MRVRVVGLGVVVDDAVVDGLVNKRMLGIKSYDLFNPKDGRDRRGQSLGNECGEAEKVAHANRPVRPNERVAGTYV